MYFFEVAEMNLSIVQNKNLHGREKEIFTIFFVVKLIEHNNRYCKVMK